MCRTDDRDWHLDDPDFCQCKKRKVNPMEYRALQRNGVCSTCGEIILAKETNVFVAGKWLKHKKRVIVCANCAKQIKKEYS